MALIIFYCYIYL